MNLTKFSTQKTTVQCYKSSCQAQLALRQMAKEAAAELEDPDRAYAEETEDAEGGGEKKKQKGEAEAGAKAGEKVEKVEAMVRSQTQRMRNLNRNPRRRITM